MKYLLMLSLLLTIASRAGAEVSYILSAPRIRFTEGDQTSCRMVKKRLQDLNKSYSALAELYGRLPEDKLWSAHDIQLYAARAARMLVGVEWLWTPSVNVGISWDIATHPQWRERLVRDEYIPVSYGYKGFTWADEWGAVPVATRWDVRTNLLHLQMNITPLELCMGATNLHLTLHDPESGDQLGLISNIVWK
ncbi:MAG TPA: hypothetical protein PKC28_12490 [Bdellovibrionales bacterium]|nr:hypothetical protein [Bdellovibrionales bacterium]